jgi:hypothetical protein
LNASLRSQEYTLIKMRALELKGKLAALQGGDLAASSHLLAVQCYWPSHIAASMQAKVLFI